MTVHTSAAVSGAAFAGVPPELLPPKKRLTRQHPYAAAARIQEMASHGAFKSPPALAFPQAAIGKDDADGHDQCDGLRAKLLHLRIARPVLVLTKLLTASDRSTVNPRLLLPDKMVRASPLLRMLTPAERRLVFSQGRAGLPVPAFDRLGRPYRMTLRRDRSARTYRLAGDWGLFLSRHETRDGDAVEVRTFRPPAWQARLEKCGSGGLGMALLHRPNALPRKQDNWSAGEREVADGLLLLAGARRPDGVGGAVAFLVLETHGCDGEKP